MRLVNHMSDLRLLHRGESSTKAPSCNGFNPVTGRPPSNTGIKGAESGDKLRFASAAISLRFMSTPVVRYSRCSARLHPRCHETRLFCQRVRCLQAQARPEVVTAATTL